MNWLDALKARLRAATEAKFPDNHIPCREFELAAVTDLDKAIRVIECYENMLSAIDRRAGSASTQSGFTDAVEVAQWARQALAEAAKIKGE